MFTTSDFIQSPNSKQSNTKQYVLYTFIFLIVLALGVLIGLEIPVIRHRTYNDGWNSARSRIANSQFQFLIDNKSEINDISGVVQSIQGSQIFISTTPLDILSDPELDTRIVQVAPNTKITKNIPRNEEVYKKELSEFMKKLQTPLKAGETVSDVGTPPSPFEESQASVNDIKAGDTIVVTTGQNIKNSKSFMALSVHIN